ncbi:hypothetical protein [Promicromonospora kroppenstedtii]|uniref:hypothetical protein n=1 Tax=Promicromonospora kroppenstedtii TaxID=440482 RepID=UPI00146FC35E|nr:hypothetical protein [Promicromonospora kroppenstedtii]
MDDQVFFGVIQVLAPSFLIAFAVIIDARLFGPYFSLSSIISGGDGMEGDWWSENPRLKGAVLRRFTYPVVTGFVLGLLGFDQWASMVTVGLLAGVLLLWPVAFLGLPSFSSRRDWEIPALYLAFICAYTLLVPAGGAISQWVTGSSEGEPIPWIADQIVGSLVVCGGSLLTSAAFFGIQSSLGNKIRFRAKEGEAEYLQYQLQKRSRQRRLPVAWEDHNSLFVGVAAVVALTTVSTLLFQNLRHRKDRPNNRQVGDHP